MLRPALTFTAALVFVVATVSGCHCDSNVKKVKPSGAVTPLQVNFGKVKVGEAAPGAMNIASLSQASLTITGITLQDGSAPGGASAFKLTGEAPTLVSGLGQQTVNLSFSPDSAQAFEAVAQIATNDEENPTLSVLLSGEGAQPDIAVTPQCETAQGCVGLPPTVADVLDFGTEAVARQVPVPANKLPNVSVVNEGDVQLVVTAIAIEGSDAAAFTIQGNTTLPDQLDDGTRVLLLDHAEGVNLPIRFTPTSEAQPTYTADLVIRSDDPDEAEVRIHLKGAVRPNLPPTVCANVIKVVSPDGLTSSFNTPSDWAPLLTPPPTGYDFTQTRPIEPSATGKNSVVTFSANSTADAATCTTDPEDERTGLTYQWKVLSAPAGAGNVGLGSATASTATLIPFASGEYNIGLTVADVQGHQVSTSLKVLVVRKEDFVAQLSWNGGDGGFKNVDLDLHLIRPSSSQGASPFAGAFSFFSDPPTSLTSGDRNGYADTTRTSNPSFNFDWGGPGSADDPKQSLDETGNGPLLENISLNYPEHDALCATAACRYKVMVHFFADRRAAPTTSCTVGGSCADGDQCNCPSADQRCVADLAPVGDAGFGPGKCIFAPQANLRLYFRANPTPAAEIPVAPGAFTVGAPCQMVYVADVWWPKQGAPDGGTALDGGSEPVVVPRSDATATLSTRFGVRSQGSLDCSPDTQLAGPQNPVGWYDPQPR